MHIFHKYISHKICYTYNYIKFQIIACDHQQKPIYFYLSLVEKSFIYHPAAKIKKFVIAIILLIKPFICFLPSCCPFYAFDSQRKTMFRKTKIGYDHWSFYHVLLNLKCNSITGQFFD